MTNSGFGPVHRYFFENGEFDLPRIQKGLNRHIEVLESGQFEDVYETVLYMQMVNALHVQLGFFSSHLEWKKAKRVLDLGCGPGHLIGQLLRFFPDKNYSGVDSNEALLGYAKRSLAGNKNVKLHLADAYDFCRGSYDFIIARALLQHLTNPKRLYQNVHRLLARDGVFLTMDACDELWFESPPLQTTIRHRRLVNQIQGKQGKDRSVVAKLGEHAMQHGFRVSHSEHLRRIFITQEEKARYVLYHLMSCATLHRLFGKHFEMRKSVNQLIAWAKLKDSFACQTLSTLVLTKISPR